MNEPAPSPQIEYAGEDQSEQDRDQAARDAEDAELLKWLLEPVNQERPHTP